jgi:sarcosine oxidase gamma subunit
VEADGQRPIKPAVATVRHEIRDHEGRLVAVHVRQDLPGGRKRLWWETPDGRRGLGGLRPVDLLYGLERITKAREVTVVEGEKCADALWSVGIAAVATVCGAAATPSNQVLRHLVRPGLRVVLWPDADEAGRKHMERIARALHRLGARDLSWVEPPAGVPAGWDAADTVAEGRDVRALLAAAKPWKPPASGPQLMTAAEVLQAENAAGPEWVVHGLVPAAGVVLLVGRPKSGKSTLARALAVAVAQGRPFLGRPVQQGPVLLLSLEDRRQDVARHFRTLGLRPEDPLLAADALDKPETLHAWVRVHRPVLVIVDTVGRILRLQDASAYAEVTQALDGLLRLARESGAALVLLHHAPKGSDGREVVDAPLGSTAFAGTADVVLHLKRAPDGVRTLASVQRVGEDLEESVVAIGPDAWPVLAGTRREVQARTLADAILDYLRSAGEASREEVLAAVQARALDAHRALQTLVQAGLVERVGSGRRGDPYRFRVAPNVEESLGNGKSSLALTLSPSSSLAQISIPALPPRDGNAGMESPKAASVLDESRSRVWEWNRERERNPSGAQLHPEEPRPEPRASLALGELAPAERVPSGTPPEEGEALEDESAPEALEREAIQGEEWFPAPERGLDGEGLPGEAPAWAVALAESLPGSGEVGLQALARTVADLLEPPLDPSPRPDTPPPRCPACGGRRWWQRPRSHGGGWVCPRCHPPRGVQPAAWHGPEEDPEPQQPTPEPEVPLEEVLRLRAAEGRCLTCGGPLTSGTCSRCRRPTPPQVEPGHVLICSTHGTVPQTRATWTLAGPVCPSCGGNLEVVLPRREGLQEVLYAVDGAAAAEPEEVRP